MAMSAYPRRAHYFPLPWGVSCNRGTRGRRASGRWQSPSIGMRPPMGRHPPAPPHIAHGQCPITRPPGPAVSIQVPPPLCWYAAHLQNVAHDAGQVAPNRGLRLRRVVLDGRTEHRPGECNGVEALLPSSPSMCTWERGAPVVGAGPTRKKDIDGGRSCGNSRGK